jgi:cytochrome b subunit of formate dehydrogenase
MVVERLPERVGHAYLLVAFFLLPATGIVLTGGTRPAGPVATVILWATVVHHSLFVTASVVD